jgi:hypothetical protein
MFSPAQFSAPQWQPFTSAGCELQVESSAHQSVIRDWRSGLGILIVSYLALSEER